MKKIFYIFLTVFLMCAPAQAAHDCDTVKDNVYKVCFDTLNTNGQTLTKNLPIETVGAYCLIQDSGSNDKIIRVLIGSPDMTNDVSPGYAGGTGFMNTGLLHFIFQSDSITEEFKIPNQTGDVMRVRGIKGFGGGNTVVLTCFAWPRR
jgi:hypothetical protein